MSKGKLRGVLVELVGELRAEGALMRAEVAALASEAKALASEAKALAGEGKALSSEVEAERPGAEPDGDRLGIDIVNDFEMARRSGFSVASIRRWAQEPETFRAWKVGEHGNHIMVNVCDFWAFLTATKVKPLVAGEAEGGEQPAEAEGGEQPEGERLGGQGNEQG